MTWRVRGARAEEGRRDGGDKGGDLGPVLYQNESGFWPNKPTSLSFSRTPSPHSHGQARPPSAAREQEPDAPKYAANPRPGASEFYPSRPRAPRHFSLELCPLFAETGPRSQKFRHSSETPQGSIKRYIWPLTMQPEPKKDFFITYNQADLSWAEWIAWELEDAGYSVIIQVWDSRPGFNFVFWMQQALTRAQRVIAVLSPDYLMAEFTKPEWTTALGDDPSGVKGRLLPIRVKPCDLEGMLKQIVYIDLVNVPESEAQRTLLDGVKAERAKPAVRPRFPGASRQTVFPGNLPPIWNVPHQRNADFLGRDDLLSKLHSSLTIDEPVTRCQAICGNGAVGKTQVALEYAYRHVGDYKLVWWVRSEEPATLAADYAGLYGALELIPRDMKDQSFRVAAVRRWLELNDGWLLIFDNAERLQDVRSYLPPGHRGHALITSRAFCWHEIAAEHNLPPLSPEDAVDLLLKRTA